MLQINCPGCKAELVVNEDYIGQKVQCHNCGQKFMLQESSCSEEHEKRQPSAECTAHGQACAATAQVPPVIVVIAILSVLGLGLVFAIRSTYKQSNLLSGKPESLIFKKNAWPVCANTKLNLLELKQKADTGDASAMYNLGFCYQNGIGVVKDETNAVALYRRGAALGDASAMTSLGFCYQNGIGVVKDETNAVALYRRGAAFGDASAMTSLGFCYQNGIGVVKDETNAVALYRRGAALGDASAMTSLGFCYQNGIGVVKDETNAVALYRKGAELGNVSAMNNLRCCSPVPLNTENRDDPLSVISSKKDVFKAIIFADVMTNCTLTLISETECEIKKGQEIHLAECSRQENKLRVVKRDAGATTVLYFDILPEGIRDSASGKMYYLPEPLAKIHEQARIARIADESRQQASQAAEQARKQAEQIEKERQAVELKKTLATNQNAFCAPVSKGDVPAQIVSADIIKDHYQNRLAIADKKKNDGIATLTQVYYDEVSAAQDDVRLKFAPLIRSAALCEKSNEVSTLTFQLESIINPKNGIGANQGPAQGIDFKQLVGKWESSEPSGIVKFIEFKPSKTVLITHVYSSNNSNSSETEEWFATTKPDKIIIERKNRETSLSSFKHWYEITIPYDADNLTFTYHTESTGRSSSRIYRLKRSLK